MVAVCLAAMWGLAAGGAAAAAGPTDDTWQAAAPLPGKIDGPIFALSVSPADGRLVLAGTDRGIFRSADGGRSWQTARSAVKGGVVALAFSPQRPGTALAGTRGAGVLRSVDGGLTWQAQPGTRSRTVRAFAFAGDLTLAASDRGVLADRGAAGWTPAGLAEVRVGTLAALTADASGLLAGGTTGTGADALPLFGSADGGQSWTPVGEAPGGSRIVAALAAPLGPEARPLLMGTNAGLFLSPDRGQTWQQLTGGGALPATDFTAAAFAAGRTDRFYVASDGGGSDRGGLWATGDGGAHFISLAPPIPTVTALAVSADDAPMLYAATFRPDDHTVAVWSYRDTGAGPRVAAATPPPGSPERAAAERGAASPTGVAALLTGPEAPYLAIACAALAVVLVALVAHVRRGRTF